MLRPGFPLESCYFDGDDRDTSFHLGCYTNNQIVGIASFVIDNNSHFNFNLQYRLRGMATHPDHLKKGVATLLLQEGEALVKLKGAKVLWFNARKNAYAFYIKCGYTFLGAEFDIPTVGPHKVMYKLL